MMRQIPLHLNYYHNFPRRVLQVILLVTHSLVLLYHTGQTCWNKVLFRVILILHRSYTHIISLSRLRHGQVRGGEFIITLSLKRTVLSYYYNTQGYSVEFKPFFLWVGYTSPSSLGRPSVPSSLSTVVGPTDTLSGTLASRRRSPSRGHPLCG